MSVTTINPETWANGPQYDATPKISYPHVHMLKFDIDPLDLGDTSQDTPNILTELAWAKEYAYYPWCIRFKPEDYLYHHAQWPGKWTLLPAISPFAWWDLMTFLLMNHERFTHRYDRSYIKELVQNVTIAPQEIWARDHGFVFNPGARFRFGSWKCENSPYSTCLHDHKVDPVHDHCLICGQPEERK